MEAGLVHGTDHHIRSSPESKLRLDFEWPLVVVCEYSDHQNRSPTADGQAADVNVGFGASISDRAMSATSLKRSVGARC